MARPSLALGGVRDPGEKQRRAGGGVFEYEQERPVKVDGDDVPRDAAAPDLESALALASPTNTGPARIRALPYAPTPTTAAVAQTKPLNGMQTALVKLAANLPEGPGKDLQAHVASVKAGLKDPPPSATADVHAASTYVKKQVGNFFQTT